MRKPQPFGVSANNPSFVVSAANLGLAAIGCGVFHNLGPSAIAVYAGGSATGVVLETIGAGQRKTVLIGNQAEVTITLAATNDSVGLQAVVNSVFDDDFSLAGVPNMRSGRSVTIGPSGPTTQFSATFMGFDRIRGIYFDASADAEGSIILVPDGGAVSQTPGVTVPFAQTGPVDVPAIRLSGTTTNTVVSDSPFELLTQQQGGLPAGATPVVKAVDEVTATTTIYTVPANNTLYLTAAWLTYIAAAAAGNRLMLNAAGVKILELPETPSTTALPFPTPVVVPAGQIVQLDGSGGVFGLSSAGFCGYLL